MSSEACGLPNLIGKFHKGGNSKVFELFKCPLRHQFQAFEERFSKGDQAMKSKSLLSSAIIVLVLLAMVMSAPAQIAAPKTIPCTACKNENEWANKFCISCGADLTALKANTLAEMQREHEAKLAALRQSAINDSLARAQARQFAEAQREAKLAALRQSAIADSLSRVQAQEKRLAQAAVIERESPQAMRAATEIQTPPKKEKPASVLVQEVKPRKPAMKIYDGPVDPRRLFLIPTADVLGPLEVSMGGGSVIGELREERRPFLGRVSIGLGGVAEIEASTVGVASGLANGSTAIPTAAFKLKFLPESNRFPFVGFAGALRSSPWHSETRENIKFEKRVSTLYFVSSKTFGRLSTHAGLSISDLRIRTKDAATGDFISPTPQWIRDNDRDYVNKNLFTPFAGLRVDVNPRTALMIEYESIPEYDFDEENPIADKRRIGEVWMIIAGVRYFVFDWLPLDTGVLYRGDYHGIGDMHIQAGLNLNLPLPRVVRAMGRN
jgi:hypothetical protein